MSRPMTLAEAQAKLAGYEDDMKHLHWYCEDEEIPAAAFRLRGRMLFTRGYIDGLQETGSAAIRAYERAQKDYFEANVNAFGAADGLKVVKLAANSVARGFWQMYMYASGRRQAWFTREGLALNVG